MLCYPSLVPPIPPPDDRASRPPFRFPPPSTRRSTLLTAQDYVAERRLATAVFLALKLKRPLFLEGEAGVGKTEIAKVLAAGLGKPLVRLQCYEGLDTAPPSTSGTIRGR